MASEVPIHGSLSCCFWAMVRQNITPRCGLAYLLISQPRTRKEGSERDRGKISFLFWGMPPVIYFLHLAPPPEVSITCQKECHHLETNSSTHESMGNILCSNLNSCSSGMVKQKNTGNSKATPTSMLFNIKGKV